MDVETTFRHTFLSSDLHCLPPGDPRVLCTNTGIRLLANHSLKVNVIGQLPEDPGFSADFDNGTRLHSFLQEYCFVIRSRQNITVYFSDNFKLKIFLESNM